MGLNKSSQVSVELITLLFILTALFLVVLSVSDHREAQLAGVKLYLSAKDIGDKVAWNINTAVISGFGSKRTFYLPAKLSDGSSYNVTINAATRAVIVTWKTRHYSSPLLTSNVVGNTSLSMGEINVTNVLGQINVTQ